MNNELCCMENIGLEMAKRYDAYHEVAELMSQYIMSVITGWQVYITERDIDIFNLNFVSDVSGDSNIVFAVRKDQLCDMDYIMKTTIIPALNCHDRLNQQ